MKTSTLKQLVIEASERAETKQDLLEEVIRLIGLFEQDAAVDPMSIKYKQAPGHQVFAPFEPPKEKVPYSTICGCHPANGGSGVCGCAMANKLVDPSVSGQSGIKLSNWTSTESFPGLTRLFGGENVTEE